MGSYLCQVYMEVRRCVVLGQVTTTERETKVFLIKVKLVFQSLKINLNSFVKLFCGLLAYHRAKSFGVHSGLIDGWISP